jgi:hypothetical protein
MRIVSLHQTAVMAFALSAVALMPKSTPAQLGGLIKKKVAAVAAGQEQAIKPAGENVAFDNIILELTPERIGKVVAGKQAGKKIATGPSGAIALREKKDALEEQLSQLRDKNSKVFDAWDVKRDAIRSCRDSVLHLAEKRITENFQMTALSDPELLQKMTDLGAAIQKAYARGDTALVRKLTMQTAAMMEPTKADSLAADRKCGSLKDAPAVVAQASSLQDQIDKLLDQIRNAEVAASKAEQEGSGLNSKQLAMACERIEYYMQRLAAKSRQAGFTAAELDALKQREVDLKGLCY